MKETWEEYFKDFSVTVGSRELELQEKSKKVGAIGR